MPRICFPDTDATSHRRTRAAAILLALASIRAAHAQERLKTITVTATRTDAAAEDVPATVTTVDKRDTERRFPPYID